MGGSVNFIIEELKFCKIAQFFLSVSLVRDNLRGLREKLEHQNWATDISEYQPPPCFVDWPEGVLEGSKRFSISQCPNIVSISSI